MSQNISFVELVLTCGSWQEAQAVADELLGKKLVAAIEFMQTNEIKLIMQSVEHLVQTIEQELAGINSKLVLQQIPLTNVSNDAKLWLEETGNARTE